MAGIARNDQSKSKGRKSNRCPTPIDSMAEADNHNWGGVLERKENVIHKTEGKGGVKREGMLLPSRDENVAGGGCEKGALGGLGGWGGVGEGGVMSA